MKSDRIEKVRDHGQSTEIKGIGIAASSKLLRRGERPF